MKHFCLKTEKKEVVLQNQVYQASKRNMDVSCNEKIKTNY